MADHSWVQLTFRSTDPATVQEVRDLLGWISSDVEDRAGLDWTNLGCETSYGLAEDAEAFLMERGIPFSRYSDGKYEYDGDEAHWAPGMDAPRVFTRLNNGGRCITESDVNAFRQLTKVPKRMDLYARIHEKLAGSPLAEAFLEIQEDAEIGSFVREAFAFSVEHAKALPRVNQRSGLVRRALRAWRKSPDTRALKRELRDGNPYALALVRSHGADYVDGDIVAVLKP